MRNRRPQYPDHVERFAKAVEIWRERKDEMIANHMRARRRREAKEAEAIERDERARESEKKRKADAMKRKRKQAADRKKQRDEANARTKAFQARLPRKIPKRTRKPPARYAGNGVGDQIGDLLYG
eukprot:COSAG02_NODE_19119_length_899_cov_1.088750_2_plen_125_part_00